MKNFLTPFFSLVLRIMPPLTIPFFSFVVSKKRKRFSCISIKENSKQRAITWLHSLHRLGTFFFFTQLRTLHKLGIFSSFALACVSPSFLNSLFPKWIAEKGERNKCWTNFVLQNKNYYLLLWLEQERF